MNKYVNGVETSTGKSLSTTFSRVDKSIPDAKFSSIALYNNGVQLNTVTGINTDGSYQSSTIYIKKTDIENLLSSLYSGTQYTSTSTKTKSSTTSTNSNTNYTDSYDEDIIQDAVY